MSYGPLAGMYFNQGNNQGGGRGIFWQNDKPKQEPKKFGYKTKKLRHPIRRPDDEVTPEEIEAAKEADRRRFNKNKKDFINSNKNRVRGQQPEPKGTEIKPGTVTLTQDQLAALLASLGKVQGDNSLKISIDNSSNKIQVEQYASDDDKGDVVDNGDDRDDDDDVGIAAFLNADEKPKSRKNKEEDKRPRSKVQSRQQVPSSSGQRPQASREAPKPSSDNSKATGRQSEVRLSLEEAKREAGVSHIPDVVPMKHLTVGERKRLQWARERAELAEDYNPWGRPGGGAPTGKSPPPQQKPETQNPWGRQPRRPEEEPPQRSKESQQHREERREHNSSSSQPDIKKQQEILEDEIAKLQREIREAEERKRQREEKTEKEEKKAKAKEEKKVEKAKTVKKEKEIRQEKKKEPEGPSSSQQQEVQIVFVTKKKGRDGKSTIVVEKETADSVDNYVPAADSPTGDNEPSADSDNAGGKANDDSNELPPGNKTNADTKASVSGDQPKEKQRPPSEETAHLSKKELERRQWLAELNKQREEQRMRKQQEKERDRQGIHDQWADRFVYHKTLEQISPRKNQDGPRISQEAPASYGSPPGAMRQEAPRKMERFSEDPNPSYAPPAAMRSALVIGTGTLNENRYDNRKAEEKRKWLEELEHQREEQRLAKAAQKERDFVDQGTWADRYPTDQRKLNEAASKGERPDWSSQQRTTSAPSAPQQANSNTDVTGTTAGTEEVPTYLRGQGVFVDPVTRKEQEEKRRIYLEYQAQVKAQIEEKERQKREERERKIREDMEEERKLQQERDAFQNQLEQEQRKVRAKEEERQRQLNDLKLAMDAAQEQAQEEKNQRRLQHLATKGHDVAHLKATYDEPPQSRMSRQPPGPIDGATPRKKTYDTSAIPGLEDSDNFDLPPSPPRQPQAREAFVAQRERESRMGRRENPMGPAEPYVEDRVLTPSRFRQPSKPWTNPDSPKREFGTQTLELKDLQAILNSLPDEVQIEYKLKVEEALKNKQREPEKSKREKPRAPRGQDTTDGGPGMRPNLKGGDKRSNLKPGERRLNLKAEDKKPNVKPEEKRPNLRPGERPKWNQNQKRPVKKNSEKDPFYQQKKEEKEERKAKRERQLQYLQELNKERIPDLSKNSPGRNGEAAGPPAANKGRQQARPAKRETPADILSVHDMEPSTGRASPPIPTVRHRTTDHRPVDSERDPYYYANNYLQSSQTDTRYGDADIAPLGDGEFLPFMRTTEILDPSKAEEPLAVSRENSRMERARRHYLETHNPANKGRKLDIYQDREREAKRDPLYQPSLVTDHPTGRQDMILQQLSSLKQTLMDRRKELETNMSMDGEKERLG